MSFEGIFHEFHFANAFYVFNVQRNIYATAKRTRKEKETSSIQHTVNPVWNRTSRCYLQHGNIAPSGSSYEKQLELTFSFLSVFFQFSQRQSAHTYTNETNRAIPCARSIYQCNLILWYICAKSIFYRILLHLAQFIFNDCPRHFHMYIHLVAEIVLQWQFISVRVGSKADGTFS